MTTLVEIAVRVGPLLLFGVVFIAFVYGVTQGLSGKAGGQ